ncbi:MAG: hypothetical protein ACTH6Y_11685 [Vibrio hibernica]
MKTLHHLRTSTATRWALTLVLWVILVCLMKNMSLLSAACSVSTYVPNNDVQHIESISNNKVSIDKQSECHLSEKLLQFHLPQIDSVVITSLFPSLMIAVFVWFSLTSHRIFYKPLTPKRRRHLELCTFQE